MTNAFNPGNAAKFLEGLTKRTNLTGKVADAQYNVKATGHVAKLRRDLSV